MIAPELTEYLSIGRNRSYDLLHDGSINIFRIGSSCKVNRRAVNYYIQKKPD